MCINYHRYLFRNYVYGLRFYIRFKHKIHWWLEYVTQCNTLSYDVKRTCTIIKRFEDILQRGDLIIILLYETVSGRLKDINKDKVCTRWISYPVFGRTPIDSQPTRESGWFFCFSIKIGSFTKVRKWKNGSHREVRFVGEIIKLVEKFKWA